MLTIHQSSSNILKFKGKAYNLDSSIASINIGVKDLNTELNYIYIWATANGLRIKPKTSKCSIICKQIRKGAYGLHSTTYIHT